MEHFIWSTGEKVEKSSKNDHPNLKEKEKVKEKEKEKDVKKNNEITIGDEFIKGSNKREVANNKLNDRNMISQIGQNPFMANNNYLHDLEVQQNFLIPKNSNYKEGNKGLFHLP
jgi:hypothetical protein